MNTGRSGHVSGVRRKRPKHASCVRNSGGNSRLVTFCAPAKTHLKQNTKIARGIYHPPGHILVIGASEFRNTWPGTLKFGNMNNLLQIPVIDLFAGPVGLGEGFAAYEDAGLQFRKAISIEKDACAHRTL